MQVWRPTTCDSASKYIGFGLLKSWLFSLSLLLILKLFFGQYWHVTSNKNKTTTGICHNQDMSSKKFYCMLRNCSALSAPRNPRNIPMASPMDRTGTGTAMGPIQGGPGSQQLQQRLWCLLGCFGHHSEDEGEGRWCVDALEVIKFITAWETHTHMLPIL